MSEKKKNDREDLSWKEIYETWEAIPILPPNFIEITYNGEPHVYSRVTSQLSRVGDFIKFCNPFDMPPRLIAEIRIKSIESFRPLLNQKNVVL